jgi:general secretion pathway protein F
MKTYEYRGFDRAGRACRGLVEAMNVKESREKLAAEGTLAERITLSGRRMRFAADARAMVYRELSVLLGAGVPLVRALDNLIQSPELAAVHLLLAGIRDRVREGMPLAAALGEASHSVSAFEIAIIEAAERAATVEGMLDRLAAFLEERERLREKVQAALIYPLIVMTVGICVAVVMLGLLLPRARDILAGGQVALPGLTRFMIAFGALLTRWGLAAAAAGVLAVFWGRRRLRGDALLRERLDQRLFRLPLWGRGYALLVNLRFARTLSILLGGGVPLVDSLVLAGRATGSEYTTRRAREAAEEVRHGSSLADAVRRIGPLADSLPGWLQIGEASGGLERLLDSAAQRYQDRWDRFVARCLSVLEPVLILVIGGFVLVVTVSVLLPILSLTRAVGR